MVEVRSTWFTLVLFAVGLFVIANVVSLFSGLAPVYALIDNVFGALEIYYYVPSYPALNNPYVLVSSFLDTMVFALITVIMAVWFFNFINNLSIREKIVLSRLNRLKDHVILAPFTPLAEELLRDFGKSGVKAVVITDKRDDLPRLYENNHMAILGDVRSTDVFLAAGISRARFVVACGQEDLQNTLITVTAKNANPNIKVIARVSDESDIPKLSIAGAYMTVKPEIAAGERVAGELMKRLI